MMSAYFRLKFKKHPRSGITENINLDNRRDTKMREIWEDELRTIHWRLPGEAHVHENMKVADIAKWWLKFYHANDVKRLQINLVHYHDNRKKIVNVTIMFLPVPMQFIVYVLIYLREGNGRFWADVEHAGTEEDTPMQFFVYVKSYLRKGSGVLLGDVEHVGSGEETRATNHCDGVKVYIWGFNGDSTGVGFEYFLEATGVARDVLTQSMGGRNYLTRKTRGSSSTRRAE